MITLTATDSQGDVGTAQVSLTIEAVQLDEFIFRWETNTIPVEIAGNFLLRPFADGIGDSKPALVDIDNDGDLDLFVGESEGKIIFFRASGAQSKLLPMKRSKSPSLSISPKTGARS